MGNSRTTFDPAAAAEQTPHRLLDAAEVLFAERGYAHTSVRDITRAAGCNVAAVNYHFGSKGAMYEQMFRRRLTELREQRLAAVDRARRNRGDLEAVLRTFANAFLEPLVDVSAGRRMMQLFMREMTDPHLPAGIFYDLMIKPVSAQFRQVLTEACEGLGEAAAQTCFFSLVGQLLQILQLQNIFAGSSDADSMMPDLSAWVDHVVRFSAAGIRASAQG